MILAASMALQSTPYAAFASEETSAVVSQKDEVTDTEQDSKKDLR